MTARKSKAKATKKPAKAKPKPKPKSKPKAKPKRRRPRTRIISIIDSAKPLAALRRYLATIRKRATVSQGQIALGAAQLLLLNTIDAGALVDLVLAKWTAFPDRTGFHAQELLRNAIAALADDPERLARVIALVPADASAELRGALPAEPTPIPVDVEPHVAPVRAAIDRAVDTIAGFGEAVALGPPAALDRVLALESARRVALPNEYRALLTLHDGMTLWDAQFLGTADLRGDTPLARRARAFLERANLPQCVVIASWGATSWLLYDPRGAFRGGEPGYVILLTADEWPQDSLVAALRQLAETARDVLGGTTN